MPSFWTEEGIRIDESDEQQKKALCLIDESSEPDSNVTVQSDRHPLKQEMPSFLANEGM
jgi:hypothetical protein